MPRLGPAGSARWAARYSASAADEYAARLLRLEQLIAETDRKLAAIGL